MLFKEANMNKQILTGALCALLPLSASLAQDKPHWTYEGRTGATHWSELDESFKTCKLGKHQSPINIETKKAERAALKPIEFAYKSEPAEVVNTGHSIQVNLPAGSSATIDGVQYQLVQFHFHTPSEEKFDGKGYPMVAHLVHKDAQGKLAAVAILFKEGKENAALKPIFSDLPPKAGDTRKLPGVDAAALLPAARGFYAFTGSLTTPPCSEEVTWRVLKTPVNVSESQLTAIRKLYKVNARPVQPLNDRKVEVSE
jgi:carbonic anhydrase